MSELIWLFVVVVVCVKAFETLLTSRADLSVSRLQLQFANQTAWQFCQQAAASNEQLHSAKAEVEQLHYERRALFAVVQPTTDTGVSSECKS